MNLDEMFGSFNPTKQQAGKKRTATTPIETIEKVTEKNSISEPPQQASEEEEDVVEIPAIDADDDCLQEDARLAKEGEAMLQQIQSETGRIGYDSADFVTQLWEYDNCTHEYVGPKDYTRPADWKRPKVKPKQYKFTLDKFQDRAVECIERGESVLVAAHTSAGKTAIAEFAIAQSLKANQRVIYTSPIKALSNQKYRELAEEFGDVGLMTGDVTINESAGCLVMTTEILRSMLYNGSEIVREMAWVIFDEVHYMRDKERGVVWEETIIMLPTAVKHVFLSATIPNAREFCEWIVKIKNQPCNVVYTDFRPTPLQHYLYPTGADGIYLVVDEKGVFRENNFAKAIQVIEDDMSITKVLEKKGGKGDKGKQQKQTQSQEMKKLITLIVSKGLDPVIVFSFSKRECEAYSMSLKSCDFNSEDERDSIGKIFNNAIDTLADEDK